jgi:DNA-binding beta-propeller fold protein YncE
VRLRWGMVAGLAGAMALAAPAAATGGSDGAYDHVGTFEVPANLRPGEPIDTITSAEIVAATPGGRTLVYTDSPAGRIGFIDISRPRSPRPGGALDMGGEPTSVAIAGSWALVAVNTSESFTDPSGELAIVDVRSQRVVRRLTLAGQPDSVALSPDRRYAAIVIENERDEDVNDGLIPQPPAGTLQVLDLAALLLPWRDPLRTVPLTGLAEYAPTDPEPEYVDINRRNQAVVSLQENNHLAIVDLATAKVIRHFSAGRATLEDVDATEEELGPQGQGLIELADTIDRRREPDAVQWIDDDTFATANEGDYEDENGEEGGSRGFTLFHSDGRVEWESGASLEHEIVRAGHFPQARAENKGNEPEGLEVAKVGRRTLLFVGSERANAVAVYDVSGRGAPRFLQILPTGIGPEGISAIPERGLLAVSAETDGKADGLEIRSIVTLYELDRGRGKYPYIHSGGDERGLPVPWVALSGLSGDPSRRDTLWAVSDSYLAQAYLYRVDVSRKPALITQRIPVGGVDVSDQALGDFDLEGVVVRPEGGFWFASEGRTNVGSSRPNLLVRTDAAGTVLDSVPLPAILVTGATSSGFEGVTATGSAAAGDETVWAVIQREWADDDRGFVKIARYDVAANRWTFARYPLGPVESPAGGLVGLSEMTLLPDGHTVAIVERDDRLAGQARVKRLFGVDLDDPSVTWRGHGEPLDTVDKRLLRDVLGDLDAASITVPDKLEGVGVGRDGRLYLVTDNDGVDENYGETVFLGLGDWRRALRGFG